MDSRWYQRAAIFAWVMVGVPLFVEPPLAPWRLGVWLGAYLVFAAAAWRAARAPHAALFTAQSAAVITMVAVLCNGYEGALLVLVAMQVGGRRGARAGLGWIAAQTAGFALAIALHWTPRSALLLVPPYLGLQVLGLAVVRLVARVEAAGRLAERLRIARELHDAVGHHLTALGLNLEVAAHHATGAAAEPLRTAREITRLLLDEVRDVVAALERGDPVDVAAALRRLAAEMPAPRVHLTLPERLAPPREVALLLLRCAQELCTNAARHAEARNLWIDVVDRDGALELRARDDGAGATDPRPGSGLAGLRARVERLGGSLAIETAEGRGFAVTATLPGGGA